MNIKIISDGTPAGTKVYDKDKDCEITNETIGVNISITADKYNAEVTLLVKDLEFTGKAEIS